VDDAEIKSINTILAAMLSLPKESRRRVLAYVCARAEALPLIGEQGAIDEPDIVFPSQQHDKAAD